MNSLCPASRPAILLQIIIAQSITIQSKAFGLHKVTYPLDQVQKSALFVVQHPLAVNKKNVIQFSAYLKLKMPTLVVYLYGGGVWGLFTEKGPEPKPHIVLCCLSNDLERQLSKRMPLGTYWRYQATFLKEILLVWDPYSLVMKGRIVSWGQKFNFPLGSPSWILSGRLDIIRIIVLLIACHLYDLPQRT